MQYGRTVLVNIRVTKWEDCAGQYGRCNVRIELVNMVGAIREDRAGQYKSYNMGRESASSPRVLLPGCFSPLGGERQCAVKFLV